MAGKQIKEDSMSENTYGKIEKLELRGPFEGKNGKPDYTITLVTVGGVEYTTFKEVPFEEGDNVHIFFTTVKKGNFINNSIVKIEKTSEEVVSSVSNKKTKNVVDNVVPKSITSSVVNNLGSKDISMEVSGLLQALVRSAYFTNREEGLELENLEFFLRKLLNMKRRIAKELEEKGNV